MAMLVGFLAFNLSVGRSLLLAIQKIAAKKLPIKPRLTTAVVTAILLSVMSLALRACDEVVLNLSKSIKSSENP